MISNLQNSQQNYEESESKENKSGGHDSDGDCNSSLKLLRREFHNSLDLNRPIVDSILIEFDERCKLFIKSENNVGHQVINLTLIFNFSFPKLTNIIKVK